MQLHNNVNLKPYHTFGIDQKCHQLVLIESVHDLQDIYSSSEYSSLPKLMLGKGSNMLFTKPYNGLVMINRISGINHTQDDEFHYLHVEGGEDWPELVAWSIEEQIAGLENLAMIPGCAGSAPIQNIGAYGVEFKDVCNYVDYLCLDTLEIKRLSKDECEFGYRDSVFKHRLYKRAIVVAVGLKLTKHWQPITSYGPLKALTSDCSAKDIYQSICKIRMEKLPDPEETGNAGSFFKNPVVDNASFAKLKIDFPDIVAFHVEAGVKLAAGWLIDNAGLKGMTHGGAQVHPNQALVLINKHSATAQDIVELASLVRHRVYEKYGVELEHEVRFMGSEDETYLSELMEKNE